MLITLFGYVVTTEVRGAIATICDEAMTQDSRRIVEARWLADEPATLHDLAAEFGVSAERIRQIESKAMQKMRGSLAPLVA